MKSESVLDEFVKNAVKKPSNENEEVDNTTSENNLIDELKEANRHLKTIADGVKAMEILMIVGLLAVIAIVWLPTLLGM